MNASTRPFDDIRALLRAMPEAGRARRSRRRASAQAQLTKPAGSLGRLEEIAEWLAAWQGAARPHVDAPLVAVFAGNHGVVAQGVSPYPAIGDAGDGRQFLQRRRGDQSDLQDLRHFAESLRARAGAADRRHHARAGARREGLRGDDGLRHGGARLAARSAVPRRNGHRQHHGRRRDLSRALRRQGGGLGRPRHRRRRRRAQAQGGRRARGGRAASRAS